MQYNSTKRFYSNNNSKPNYDNSKPSKRKSSKRTNQIDTTSTNAQARKLTNKKYSNSLMADNTKRNLIVPRVPPTDNIPTHDIQTEGLFAGYRPLFLGNSSINRVEKSNVLDNFFSSFANLKIVDEETSDSKEVKVQDILDDLQRETQSVEDIEKIINKNRKPIIPWDASISGMVYNDESFKDVPKNVVSKLKPFKVIKIEKNIDVKEKPNKANEMIVMKVHNSKVSDESKMVNFYELGNTKAYGKQIRSGAILGVSRQEMIDAKKNYEREIKSLPDYFKFMKADQRVYDTYVNKLNRFLGRELYKQTKLNINSHSPSNGLPLFIYLPQGVASKNALQRILRKMLTEHSMPVLSTIVANCESDTQKKGITLRVTNKIIFIISELLLVLPSYQYKDETVECLLSSSPIPNFGRLYWLKQNKRQSTFYGRNIDLDYVFNLNPEYDVTRSNIRYMRYPIALTCKSFREAFSEEIYFD